MELPPSSAGCHLSSWSCGSNGPRLIIEYVQGVVTLICLFAPKFVFDLVNGSGKELDKSMLTFLQSLSHANLRVSLQGPAQWILHRGPLCVGSSWGKCKWQPVPHSPSSCHLPPRQPCEVGFWADKVTTATDWQPSGLIWKEPTWKSLGIHLDNSPF
jgi:hypothetical protein